MVSHSVSNIFVVKSSDLLAGKAAPETSVAAGPPASPSRLEATLVAPAVSVPTHRCLPTAATKKLSSSPLILAVHHIY